jgi:hypothetical protein
MKSAAYIRASAGGVGRSCDLLRASMPVESALDQQPVDRRRRRQGSMLDIRYGLVGVDLSDRGYFKQAGRARDLVFSDFLSAAVDQVPIMMAAYPVSAIAARGRTRHRRRRQSRLDVEDHGRSQRPARHFGGSRRQRGHGAGSAGRSGQHGRPPADSVRCCRPSPTRPSIRIRRSGSVSFRSDGSKRTRQLLPHSRHAIAPDRQRRRSQGCRQINREIRTAYLQLGFVC